MTGVREKFRLSCPRCGSDAEICIEVTSWVRLHPHGIEDEGDRGWSRASRCWCLACNTTSVVSHFAVEDEQAPAAD